jgi:two-component system CheB/CheR fusion protein
MPADSDPGMAFVLVQHLAPDHKSILTELIQRYTRMQVFEVDGRHGGAAQLRLHHPAQPRHGVPERPLQLLEPTEPRGQRLPIDFFFRSLARTSTNGRSGIVLSAPAATARWACARSRAKAAWSWRRARLHRVRRHAAQRHRHRPGGLRAAAGRDAGPAHGLRGARLRQAGAQLAASSTQDRNALKKIFVLLRAQTGHDFSQYKMSTIHRRIERRMAVHQIEALDGYVKYLQQTPPRWRRCFATC